ncbi:MAG: ArnT family glycosyltransferase [Microgenomates group bacterium]
MEKNFKKNKNEVKLLFLILIFLVAGFLRFWEVTRIPPGLFGDEVDTGYQAYSILKTGKDYFGNFLPVHFQSLGDWRVPLYIYLDTLFVAIFGLTEMAVRLPAVILGMLSVLAVFFLVQKFTKNKNIALLSAFLLAISPWHFHISRIGLEVNFLPVLFPLGILCFWKGLENKKRFLFILSAIFLGLTPYAYNTSKLFLPLILVVLFYLWRKEVLSERKNLMIFLIVLFIVLLPLGKDFLKGTSQARFLGISIFNNPQTAEKVRLAREKCDYQGIFERVLHNKVVFWFDDFVKNYLSAISPSFLFGSGDPNPRHSIGGRGEMYLWELPFLILGLIFAFWQAIKEKNKFFQFSLWWLVLAPIPASLTLNGGTHALRLFLFLPWLQIFTALGIGEFFNYLKNKKFKIIFGVALSLVIILSCFNYFHHYFVHYPKISGRWWNYGYKKVFEYVNKVENKYERIYISPSWEPSTVYSLFYGKFSPYEVQKEITLTVNALGKYHFYSPDLGRVKRGEGDLKTLYIVNPAELAIPDLDIKKSPYVRFVKEIKTPDGLISFVIFSSADIKENE